MKNRKIGKKEMPIKIYLYNSSTADKYIYIFACTGRKSRHNNHRVINVQLKYYFFNKFST